MIISQTIYISTTINITILNSNGSYKLVSADVMVVWNRYLNGNYSLVLSVKYGKISFPFTGDINYKVKEEIYDNNPDIFRLLR